MERIILGLGWIFVAVSFSGLFIFVALMIIANEIKNLRQKDGDEK